MSKKVYYRQCKMRKKHSETSYSEQVSYIPEEFAVMNKVLKLKENGEWDDGWVVIGVSSDRHADEEVPDYHQAIKAHRKATGDSQRK